MLLPCKYCSSLLLHCVQKHARREIANFVVMSLPEQNKLSLHILDHVYFVHPSTDISVDISTNISTEISADISTDTRPTHLDQYIGRVSVDMSTDISVKHQSICRPTLDRYVDRYIGRGVHKIHMIPYSFQYAQVTSYSNLGSEKWK